MEQDDLIHLDVEKRLPEIAGVKSERKTPEESDAILAVRRKSWNSKLAKYKSGVLRLFGELAASPMKGACFDYSRFEKE